MRQQWIIGSNKRMEQGRSGKKIYADIPGKKRERISMIGRWMGRKFTTPMTFTGGCNTDVFNAWTEQLVLPKLPSETVVKMK